MDAVKPERGALVGAASAPSQGEPQLERGQPPELPDVSPAVIDALEQAFCPLLGKSVFYPTPEPEPEPEPEPAPEPEPKPSKGKQKAPKPSQKKPEPVEEPQVEEKPALPPPDEYEQRIDAIKAQVSRSFALRVCFGGHFDRKERIYRAERLC